MTARNATRLDAYRRQIRQCAHSLAVAKNEQVRPFLPSPDVAGMVDVYTDGNLDKRIWKLTDQFEFMSSEFDELDDWMQEYIRTVPLQAYDTGSSDSSLFLDWVREHKPLSDEQCDCIACHQSRIAVEETARVHRMAHVRFQDRLTVSESLLNELKHNADLTLQLNPIRVWTAFRTPLLLDDDADLPADVLFFPVGVDIRTAVLEFEGRQLIETLEGVSPCRLTDLATITEHQHAAEFARIQDLSSDPSGLNSCESSYDALLEVLRDLVEMGLVALG